MATDKWAREDVKIQEPLQQVIIHKRPWVYIDLSKTKFSSIRLLISLSILLDLAVIGFTSYALIAMLNSPQWPNAGLVFGGLLTGQVIVLFCLFFAYAISASEMW